MLAGLFRFVRGVVATGFVLFGLLLLLVTVSPPETAQRAAVSQPVVAVEDMPCSEVRSIFEAANPDKAKWRAIFETTERLLVSLDAERAGAGRSRIYARMSEDGRLNMKAHVTGRCEMYPKDTLRQSAVTTYEGREALGRTIGTND